jgi:hypothetical protein
VIKLSNILKEVKGVLKEYTDMDFSGKETLSQIEKPDMFGQQAFDELFPMAVRSETAAIRALKNYDMISNPSPMFVHMQVDYLEDEAGEEYKLHQSQFYNSNFQDARNPRVTVLSLTKLADKDNPSPQAQKDTRLGNMLVKTEDYIKDLKRLKITKTVS